jgi:hypothetical protein
MRSQISQFEFKRFGKKDWEDVSEITALAKLVYIYARVTPVLTDMIRGKEIITPDGVFRIKNCANEGRDY